MAVMDILKEILDKKLVVIARRIPQDKIKKCVNAVIEGGVSLIESTFDQSADDCIEKNKAEYCEYQSVDIRSQIGFCGCHCKEKV